MPLSDTKLRNLVGKVQEPITLSHRESLSVRVSKKGTITWQYRCRYQRKQVIVSLGRYPGLSIKDAQNYIPKLKQWLKENKDPRIELKNQNIIESDCPTIAEIAKSWLEKRVPDLRERTQHVYANQVNKWIYPHLNTPSDDMRLSDWIRYFDMVKESGSAKTAGFILVRLKSIVGWAYKRGEISPNNPVLQLNVSDVGKASTPGHRVLQLNEIAKLWIQIERSKATPATKLCLQLILLTGARQSEARTAEWKDFNFTSMIWTVPPEKSKTGKPINRPISKKVKELLDTLGMVYGKFGFLIPGASQTKAMTTHSINRFCARMHAHLYEQWQIPKFTPHDARRSLSTLLSEAGVAPHVTEKMLGHVLRGVMGIYNKHDWIKEQLEAYDLYWGLITEAIEAELK
ncbi:MAG: tyrosine-type recombinase/integrase [Alteromonadaceae bacterium]|nr:tyrosine-type recombinase/integrase [Alteromonadaceae bacterium]